MNHATETALTQQFSHIFITFNTILAVASVIVFILYLRSLFIAMGAVPKEKRRFPRWFIWMILIPLAGLVFAWMMLPFGLPKSFKIAFPKNEAILQKARTLFGLGLTQAILLTLCLIPYLAAFFGIAYLVLMIIYWVKAVQIHELASKTPAT